MHIDDCLATFEFFENRLQESVSQIDAVGVREKNEPIQLKDIECIQEFLKGGSDIWQGEAGESSKAIWL
jgi:hypothetical protein